MKSLLFVFAFVSLAGCSKSVTKSGNLFPVTEDPNPPTIPSPVPSPTATPSPNPSPNPTPSPTPTNPVGCEPNRLGELLDYAVYVKEDFRSDHTDVSRRVAAHYACFQHGKVGSALRADATRADIATVAELGLNVAKIPNGKATYGKSLDKVRSSALGGFSKVSLDLRANLRKIFEFSNACGGMPTNTGIRRTCRTVPKFSEGPGHEVCTLEIAGESALNIAELSAADIANVTTYVIDIPSGSTLVTNLPRIENAAFRKVEVRFAARIANGDSTRLFWNFPVGDRLEFSGTKFRGTIVSPDGNVNVCDQTGEAGFWVRELVANDSSF